MHYFARFKCHMDTDRNHYKANFMNIAEKKPTTEDHWSCIAHLIAEDTLKSAVIKEKKLKNIECK